MANAKNINKKALKVLIVGEPGTMKTRIAASFPDPYFVDLDDGMGSVRGQDINYITITNRETTDPDFLEIVKTLPKLKPKETPYAKQCRFEKAQVLIEYWANMLTAEQTLVIDSLTFYSQSAYDFIASGGTQGWHIYTAAQALISDTLDIIKGLPCNVVLLAHRKVHTDEHGNITEISAQTTGRALGNVLPGHFDEVWRTSIVHKKKGEQEFILETVATKKEKGKSRTLNLPPVLPIVDNMYAAILEAADKVEADAKKSKK